MLAETEVIVVEPKKVASSLKFVDLFAGLGGFHVALNKFGMQCVFASELNLDLRKLYELNFCHEKSPSFPIVGDIHDCDIQDIPEHDVLCAGFPCQPFSQAGRRRGLRDETNGNHFYKIKEILDQRRPTFFILENVPNLKGHDNGKTWDIILEELGADYDVSFEILSPDQIGIPHHRKRIFIFGVLKEVNEGRPFMEFPLQSNSVTINEVLEFGSADKPLSPVYLKHIEVWEEFVRLLGDTAIPGFPIWASEFGATYPFEDVAPSNLSDSELAQSKGAFGLPVPHSNGLQSLPRYAQVEQSTFPDWKKIYIRKNREFYKQNRSWLDTWLPKILDSDLSHQKFEWNCGNDSQRDFKDKIIQFRPSGIRVRSNKCAPALVLISTQIPIVFDSKYGGHRHLKLSEAQRLQSLEGIRMPGSQASSFRALGNAVNAKLAEKIVANIILPQTHLNQFYD